MVWLIGALFDDEQGDASGAAYVFRDAGNIWVEEQKLKAADAGSGDEFGVSVSICGDVALIGAFLNDDRGSDSGSAYVFRYDGNRWREEQKLVASDGTAGDEFGQSVSISGRAAVVGAHFEMDRIGSAYLFQYDGNTWDEKQKLIASDRFVDDAFGSSVQMSGHSLVVGAPGNDDSGEASGSAYVFSVAEVCADLADFSSLQNCFGSGANEPDCNELDMDRNGQVDLWDYVQLLVTFIGP